MTQYASICTELFVVLSISENDNGERVVDVHFSPLLEYLSCEKLEDWLSDEVISR